MASLDLFSRDNVLGGLPAKRAASLYFLIESRTAHFVSQARTAMSRFLTDEAAEQRELEFLESFATGKEPPRKPTIQDLERYSTQWGNLIPDNPRVQAAVAHILSQKFKFTYNAVPGIRAALGLDDEAVQQAYKSLYAKPLAGIYAQQTSRGERLRWNWNALSKRLESLPPFWTAYALTVTETVGTSILAIPIAIAYVGPLAGIGVIFALGIINVLTVAAMAESVARSGQARYGNAYFGRVIHEYLGGVGSLAISIVMYVWGMLVLLACYLGIASVLADATGVPVYVWVTLVFLADLYFVRGAAHDSLNSSVAFALLVGAVNVAVILLLSFIALTQLKTQNLTFFNLPFVSQTSFDPRLIQGIFGVVLSAYLGHTAAGTCGKVVLNREPSGRSLILGSIAGELTVMLLYSLWVLAVNGALPPAVLEKEVGTVLHPLANALGPVVLVLGVVFAVMGMGMLSVHSSLGIFSLVDERIPRRSRPIILLPRRRARLLFRQRGASDKNISLALTYLGMERGQPYFRWDVQLGADTFRFETPILQRYETRMLIERIPSLRSHGIHLFMEILGAHADGVRLRATTTMDVEFEGQWDALGLSMSDLMVLPEAEHQALNWMMRLGEVSLAEVVEFAKKDENAARAMLTGLVEQGFVRQVRGEQGIRYRAQFTPKRGRQLPDEIWGALEKATGATPTNHSANRLGGFFQNLLLDERVRVVLTRISHASVYLLALWLFFTGENSFTQVISFGGEICATLAAGIFPVLVLAASRRKGEFVPSLVYRLLGHPLFILSVYVLFIATLLLYSLFIWEDAVERIAGLLTIAVALIMTAVLIRRGEFQTRLVVEVRENLNAPAREKSVGHVKTQAGETSGVFNIIANGRPADANVHLHYAHGEETEHAASGTIKSFGALRSIVFDLPPFRARQLKVRAHRVTFEIDSEPLPARMSLTCGGEKREYDLDLTHGQVVLPIDGKSCHLELDLTEAPAA